MGPAMPIENEQMARGQSVGGGQGGEAVAANKVCSRNAFVICVL